jgi:cytochrome c
VKGKTTVILLIFAACSLFTLFDNDAYSSAKRGDQGEAPKVKIVSPEDKKIISWSSQMRYEITVADAKDGDSKYGEINGSQCLMEVSFLPVKNNLDAGAAIKKLQTKKEHPGLSLIRTSNCFGCHSDKARLAGPSFEEMAKKYKPDVQTLSNLSRHILEGSINIWGSAQMPAHTEFNKEQGIAMARYILEQGKNQTQWIYAGLDGMVKIVEKPANISEGVYVLTASYTSTSKLRGQHSIILSIK